MALAAALTTVIDVFKRIFRLPLPRCLVVRRVNDVGGGGSVGRAMVSQSVWHGDAVIKVARSHAGDDDAKLVATIAHELTHLIVRLSPAGGDLRAAVDEANEEVLCEAMAWLTLSCVSEGHRHEHPQKQQRQERHERCLAECDLALGRYARDRNASRSASMHAARCLIAMAGKPEGSLGGLDAVIDRAFSPASLANRYATHRITYGP